MFRGCFLESIIDRQADSFIRQTFGDQCRKIFLIQRSHRPIESSRSFRGISGFTDEDHFPSKERVLFSNKRIPRSFRWAYCERSSTRNNGVFGA